LLLQKLQLSLVVTAHQSFVIVECFELLPLFGYHSSQLEQLSARFQLYTHISMKILGVGVDIVSNKRFVRLLQQSYADRLLARVLHNRVELV